MRREGDRIASIEVRRSAQVYRANKRRREDEAAGTSCGLGYAIKKGTIIDRD